MKGVGVKKCYTTICPPVRGDNPWALVSVSSHVQAVKQW